MNKEETVTLKIEMSLDRASALEFLCEESGITLQRYLDHVTNPDRVAAVLGYELERNEEVLQ